MITGIVALDRQHDRTGFRCGVTALDDWFMHRASQDAKRNIARVYVAIDDGIGIAGFYTLSAYAIAAHELPIEVAKKLPRYDKIPSVLIGRLARDMRCRSKGVGELLLANAMTRSVAANTELAAFAIVVEAKDAAAVAFYQRIGFKSFPLHPMRLFVPMATAAQSYATALQK